MDQRASGFSALVRSGQITRDEGLRLINTPEKYDREIIEYVKKRLKFTDEDFEMIMKQPIRSYRDFKTYKKIFEVLKPFFWLMYKMNRVTKSFYIKYTTKSGKQRLDNGQKNETP